VVSSVEPSSAAAGAGLQRGDVVEEVNRKPVRNVTDFRQVLAGVRGESVLLLIDRGGSTHYVVVDEG